MLIRGRPLGIWILCALLLAAALLVIYFFRGAYRFELIAVIAAGLAGLFIFGLIFRVRWIYFALLLFLSLNILVQLVAAAIILTNFIAAGVADWAAVFVRYWQGVVTLIALCSAISYLCRSRAKSYFFDGR